MRWNEAEIFPADPTKEGYLFKGWGYQNVKVTTETRYCDLAENIDVERIVLTANYVVIGGIVLFMIIAVVGRRRFRD